MLKPEYLLLHPESTPPATPMRPFCAVVIVEANVTDDWRHQISKWLVASGCLYMCAWGDECSKWDDSVDYANIDDFPGAAIPDDRFVYTSWHAHEPVSDALFFALYCAQHPAVVLERLIILHVSYENREADLLNQCQCLMSEYGQRED